ncbi:transmembrane protein 6/97 [Cokeromyces recurvatus]|uniref:transmembrane protein 6/97 n=1 Tax=Cokeromyces recurvatus TaxID=90255 RepID=UPI0022207C77|nr:transmembrane protein 6/97 [Cokeromyces recurvatus]KAI7900312.1 transmembrane protein 6/97 [Cokeromyces recurvatus]
MTAEVVAAKKSLFSRPLDLIYFVYFATHIPITLAIDFQVFYPPNWVPQIFKDALDFYVLTYKDPFMGSSTPIYWYLSFIVCELLIQLPFFFIACVGLIKDCKYIRLPLAIYGSHVATTVLPSILEVLLNPELKLNQTERLVLCSFYAPYFILPLIMLIDSFIRVNKYMKVNKILKKTE